MHFPANLLQPQLNHILTAKLDTKLVFDPPLFVRQGISST